MIKNKIMRPIDQWLGVNRELKMYKIACIALTCLIFFQLTILLSTMNPDPIVITVNGTERTHYIGKKENGGSTKDDVKKFLQQFIKLRYSLNGSHLDLTLKNILPLSTEGYLKIMQKEFEKEFNPQKKIEGFSQTVANIEIILSETEALAKFDKIIRFNGIPLLVPTEASFLIVKERPNTWNPYGILVNGVVEHENK